MCDATLWKILWERPNSSVLFPTVFASSCHISPPVMLPAHRERHSSYLGAARMLHLPSFVLVVQDEPSKTSLGSHEIDHGVCGFAHLNGTA